MIWPQLKIGENQYKPLHQCNRVETTKLYDSLIERYTNLMYLSGYDKVKSQMRTWIRMTESRLYQFDNAMIEDKSEEKIAKPKVRLLDD